MGMHIASPPSFAHFQRTANQLDETSQVPVGRNQSADWDRLAVDGADRLGRMDRQARLNHMNWGRTAVRNWPPRQYGDVAAQACVYYLVNLRLRGALYKEANSEFKLEFHRLSLVRTKKRLEPAEVKQEVGDFGNRFKLSGVGLDCTNEDFSLILLRTNGSEKADPSQLRSQLRIRPEFR